MPGVPGSHYPQFIDTVHREHAVVETGSVRTAKAQDKAGGCNRRILEAERADQGTILVSPAFERIAHSSTDADGRRTSALWFGDPRVQALADALCTTPCWPPPASPTRACAP
jgi:hypothetical protein